MAKEYAKNDISSARSTLQAKVARFRALAGFCKRKPMGAIGAAILILLGLIALLAPIISPHDPTQLNVKYMFAPPGGDLLLGGDTVGRDVLSRLFYGARISLLVGLTSVGLGTTLGSLLGVSSAYFGGKFDLLVQRVVDALLAFPAIILGLAIMAVLGSSLINVIIALLLVLTPGAVRTVRSQALTVKEMDYVLAAKAVGGGDWHIVLRHIVPNCMAIFIILFTITLGFAIVVEASLSFLGVGVPPDVPSWGGMLSEGGSGNFDRAPWLPIIPGAAISTAVFSMNFLGDALRDVLDPRLRSR